MFVVRENVGFHHMVYAHCMISRFMHWILEGEKYSFVSRIRLRLVFGRVSHHHCQSSDKLVQPVQVAALAGSAHSLL